MTKRIKTVSVLSSIVSQLYTFALLALGVALLVTHFTEEALLGILYDIDSFYLILSGAIGIDKWITVLVTTIVPAVLLEIFAFVQTFSPRIKVDITMILLTVVIMALCSVVWVMMIVSLALTQSVLWIAVVVVPEIIQLVVLIVLIACRKHVVPASANLEDADTVQLVEVAPVDAKPVEVQPSEVAEVEVDEVVVQNIEIPYQPQDTMSTVEMLSSIYGDVDTSAPIHNEVLVKIDKLVQYRKLGLITADECDMLSSNILHESAKNNEQ